MAVRRGGPRLWRGARARSGLHRKIRRPVLATAAPLPPHQRHPVPPTPSTKHTPILRAEIDASIGTGVEIGFAQTGEFGALPDRLL